QEILASRQGPGSNPHFAQRSNSNIKRKGGNPRFSQQQPRQQSFAPQRGGWKGKAPQRGNRCGKKFRPNSQQHGNHHHSHFASIAQTITEPVAQPTVVLQQSQMPPSKIMSFHKDGISYRDALVKPPTSTTGLRTYPDDFVATEARPWPSWWNSLHLLDEYGMPSNEKNLRLLEQIILRKWEAEDKDATIALGKRKVDQNVAPIASTSAVRIEDCPSPPKRAKTLSPPPEEPPLTDSEKLDWGEDIVSLGSDIGDVDIFGDNF